MTLQVPGVEAAMPTLEQVDLYNINCYAVNRESGEKLIALAKEALANHRWLVFLFHGVGWEHPLNASLSEHSKVLHFLKENVMDIWGATMTEIAEQVKKY